MLQAGDSFTYNAGAGGSANVVQLTFSGADASLALNTGELYVFQLTQRQVRQRNGNKEILAVPVKCLA